MVSIVASVAFNLVQRLIAFLLLRFARMRISLRFELMCLDSAPVEEGKEDRCPSIGLKKIRNLSRLGAHEDHSMKSSISTPQLTGFFGNMLY